MFNSNRPYVPDMTGNVINPTGDSMLEAARKSLLQVCRSPEEADVQFNALMQQTGGKPPTPAELVNLVEACRNVARS